MNVLKWHQLLVRALLSGEKPTGDLLEAGGAVAGVESGSVSWEEAAHKLGGHRLTVFILLPGDGRYGSDDSESGVSAEASTIAGVASALAMALIGAVSSYISYQQKKFCFSIQQGLNADYVKGENLEAVVCEEPQVKYLTLQTQAAEPPPPEAPRI
uniref:CD99 antigen-like protein 2 n=1 Tax=Halichoerus grypus TaxID=9711 RepID=UPI001659B6DF|nr:CD99 antigen-like protein 2 [Halichoerus grypus]